MKKNGIFLLTNARQSLCHIFKEEKKRLLFSCWVGKANHYFKNKSSCAQILKNTAAKGANVANLLFPQSLLPVDILGPCIPPNQKAADFSASLLWEYFQPMMFSGQGQVLMPWQPISHGATFASNDDLMRHVTTYQLWLWIPGNKLNLDLRNIHHLTLVPGPGTNKWLKNWVRLCLARRSGTYTTWHLYFSDSEGTSRIM